jgi:hypothetical protein
MRAPDLLRPNQMPDPWLFDTQALLRELDRCRELVLQIPATTQPVHFASNIAVNAIYDLQQHLRFLFHLHCEDHRAKQRAFRDAAAKPSPKRQTKPIDRQTAAPVSQCTSKSLTAGCVSTDGLVRRPLPRERTLPCDAAREILYESTNSELLNPHSRGKAFLEATPRPTITTPARKTHTLRPTHTPRSRAPLPATSETSSRQTPSKIQNHPVPNL